MLKAVADSTIMGKIIGSDHCPIMLRVDFSKIEKS